MPKLSAPKQPTAMKWKVKTIQVKNGSSVQASYRPGTTDENVIHEVLETRCYRRPSIGFDIDEGERWLDLGGNIGTFALYCYARGATCHSYEPDRDCYDLLRSNVGHLKGFKTFKTAVSASKDKKLTFWSAKKESNKYRGTIVPQEKLHTMVEAGSVSNRYIGAITTKFDGVKMDIEGAEFGIIDGGLIPPCNKLCFEYHTSRDKSMKRLSQRLKRLRQLFNVVNYTPELDKLMALGGQQRSFHDRVIYCMDPK